MYPPELRIFKGIFRRRRDYLQALSHGRDEAPTARLNLGAHDRRRRKLRRDTIGRGVCNIRSALCIIAGSMRCSAAMECNEQLKVRVSQHLDAFKTTVAEADAGRSAAVAVAITDGGLGADLDGLPSHAEWQTHAALILTKRSSKLRTHPGQWALPGGRVDAGETPEQTALREMDEEIGLKLDPSAIVGRLDDFITRSGFIMTPIVVWVGPHRGFTANEAEVDSIHRIPISEFMREDAPMLNEAEGNGTPVLRMPVGSNWIAAPTAAILYQFREVCIAGRDTRVAHFEQPSFAWR